MSKLSVRPLGPVALSADKALWPLMKVLMELNGTPEESPMLTHRWNNTKIRKDQSKFLRETLMTDDQKDSVAWNLNGFFRHMPIIGWQKYVVIEPECGSGTWWYPGWFSEHLVGVSRIKQKGPVRLLLGPNDVKFFGLNLWGKQIKVKALKTSCLGKSSLNQNLPLV